jgi:HK97 family phage major capsid protein
MAEYKERLLGLEMPPSRTDDDPMIYRMSVASEAPVRGWDEEEILLHTREAINLDRLPGMVMLWNHGHDACVGGEPLGKVLTWDIQDQKSVITFRWADTELGRKYKKLVDDGIVTNASIRYTEDASIESDGKCVITRWSVIHTSLVADPADFSVGVGRSQSYKSSLESAKTAPLEDAEVIEAQPEKDREISSTKGGEMENNLTHPIESTPEPAQPAIDYAAIREKEITRVRSITAMGEQNKMPALAETLIEGGKTVVEARAIFDRELSQRNNQRPLGQSAPDYYAPDVPQREMREYSLLRAYRSRIPGTKEYTENCLEKEISNDIATKTGKVDGINIPYRNLGLIGVRDRDVLNTSTQASGGYLIQETVLGNQFIDLLRNKSSVLSAGATFLPNLTGNYSMPGQSSGSTAYWISENESVVPDTITFRNVPFTQRTIAARLGITRNMIMQSSVEVENIARRDLATAIALGLDEAALRGTGDGKQPLGVLNTPGIGGTGLGNDGAALTWTSLVALWKSIMVGNGDVGTLGWIMPAAVAAKLMITPMQSSGVEGNFILKPDSDKLILYPYQITEQMPSNLTKGNGTNLASILLGVWSEFVIANWGTLTIDMNPYGQSWGTGGVEMLAMQSADTGVRNPACFAAYSDVVTT